MEVSTTRLSVLCVRVRVRWSFSLVFSHSLIRKMAAFHSVVFMPLSSNPPTIRCSCKVAQLYSALLGILPMASVSWFSTLRTAINPLWLFVDLRQSSEASSTSVPSTVGQRQHPLGKSEDQISVFQVTSLDFLEWHFMIPIRPHFPMFLTSFSNVWLLIGASDRVCYRPNARE